MYHSFYIPNGRLAELKNFIRNHTPSVRFVHNPLKEGEKYWIALTMTVEDNNKLSELFNKWYDIDNPKIEKKTLKERILNIFKL